MSLVTNTTDAPSLTLPEGNVALPPGYRWGRYAEWNWDSGYYVIRNADGAAVLAWCRRDLEMSPEQVAEAVEQAFSRVIGRSMSHGVDLADLRTEHAALCEALESNEEGELIPEERRRLTERRNALGDQIAEIENQCDRDASTPDPQEFDQ